MTMLAIATTIVRFRGFVAIDYLDTILMDVIDLCDLGNIRLSKRLDLRSRMGQKRMIGTRFDFKALCFDKDAVSMMIELPCTDREIKDPMEGGVTERTLTCSNGGKRPHFRDPNDGRKQDRPLFNRTIRFFTRKPRSD